MTIFHLLTFSKRVRQIVTLLVLVFANGGHSLALNGKLLG
jgi:hypothetical protein